MVGEPLASVLRSGRAEFNARFGEARRLHPQLAPEVFARFIEETLDPVVTAVHSVVPQHVAEVTQIAYEIGLDLVGQNLAGPQAAHRQIEEGWRRILPGIASLTALAPAQVLSALSNALHNLVITPGAQPELWISLMSRGGPECPDPATWLRLGQLAAWRAGLAHFRQSALAAASQLPDALALRALAAPAQVRWPDLRERLLADPWFDPELPKAGPSSGTKPWRVVGRVGKFRGWGGLFLEPAYLCGVNEYFWLRSGAEVWLLTADIFGATFHRATGDAATAAQTDSGTKVEIRGKNIHWRGQSIAAPVPGEITSVAANTTTLAITSRLTYAVTLIALNGTK